MAAIIFLLFLALLIFISIKISNLKNRATQHVLKNTGFSQSDITAGINSGFEKKYMEKFLRENTTYTEETIRDIFKQYTIQIFNRNPISEFGEKICEKMQTDSKLDKMKDMEFRRASITYYSNSKLGAKVTYTDGKDEYDVVLSCNIMQEKIEVEKYQINKGAVVGF